MGQSGMMDINSRKKSIHTKTHKNTITNWLSNNGVEWVSVGGSENITEKPQHKI